MKKRMEKKKENGIGIGLSFVGFYPFNMIRKIENEKFIYVGFIKWNLIGFYAICITKFKIHSIFLRYFYHILAVNSESELESNEKKNGEL